MPKTGSVFIDAFAQFMVFFRSCGHPDRMEKGLAVDTLNFLMIFFCFIFFSNSPP